MLKKLLSLFHRHGLYVIADARDSSLTLSKGLCKAIGVYNLDENKVLVCSLSGHSVPTYGFILNPKLETETQLSEIQYNSKHKCIGFETLCPTVNRIFYDYGLPAYSICKLSVKAAIAGDGTRYFIICNPHE